MRAVFFILMMLLLPTLIAGGPVTAGTTATVCCTAQWFWMPWMIICCTGISVLPIPPSPNPCDPTMICQIAGTAAMAAPTP